MTFKRFTLDPSKASDSKVKRAIEQFQQLLSELSQRNLPTGILDQINAEIDKANALIISDRSSRRALYKAQKQILIPLEKELKYVPKAHYQTQWMSLGLAAFGIPLGVAFGISLGNMAFIGTGIPLGMVIGMGVGAQMDQKAAAEGRQLDFKLIY